uniref:Reverse transcriptase domain-containing protein n=1 Tax=Sander lucioperca TaxID=283035 RepID=A0A8D0AP61_SANLU
MATKSPHLSPQCGTLSLISWNIADKPDKLLARQLKGLQARRMIHKIKTKAGTVSTCPKEINENFRKFYEDLYTSKTSADTAQISDFLQALHLPKISSSAQKELNANITLEEVKEAIQSFPNGKTPGPDGFSIEFYKAYSDKVAPIMLRMFNHSIVTRHLPESLYSANISLILKKDKDETDPVFTKILANRLNKHIANIIHHDQTGFIPGRFSFINVRRLMNIMYSRYDKDSKIAILALDAQKAFDQIEWRYVLTVIKEFGLGDGFASWVEMLYAAPTASVITNYNRSPIFPLQRSCRQGCPLSPLLFAIAMEPLAISIRNHLSITPLILGRVDHRISLYADDVVLFLSHPENSLPPLLELIKTFGGFSGYTINWEKSELMPLVGDMDPDFLNNLPFHITEDKIKYLGVVIPKNPTLLYKLNYLNLLEKLKSNIETWRLLPLSMIGRVNAIKMVALPRFLYLFQNLPIFLPKAFFKQLDSIILPFVWGFKAHRISKKHITKPKSAGGLSLPVLRHYYWAANARALMYWQDAYPGNITASTPPWLAIEQDISKSSLPALLFSQTSLNHIR